MKTKWVQIEVTEGDIANGERNQCDKCPIALAIRRHLIDGVMVDVGSSSVSFFVGTEEKWYTMLPNKASYFILSFDVSSKGDKISPLTFPLSIPVEFLKKGTI